MVPVVVLLEEVEEVEDVEEVVGEEEVEVEGAVPFTMMSPVMLNLAQCGIQMYGY